MKLRSVVIKFKYTLIQIHTGAIFTSTFYTRVWKDESFREIDLRNPGPAGLIGAIVKDRTRLLAGVQQEPSSVWTC